MARRQLPGSRPPDGYAERGGRSRRLPGLPTYSAPPAFFSSPAPSPAHASAQAEQEGGDEEHEHDHHRRGERDRDMRLRVYRLQHAGDREGRGFLVHPLFARPEPRPAPWPDGRAELCQVGSDRGPSVSIISVLGWSAYGWSKSSPARLSGSVMAWIRRG